ncbi:TylF/MycF/NovP-related O-methyltransferase [Nocardioides sp. MH1]|uniref:TylF/MycF/NovP-related O-methyltransferase n=1 Tax=Nocardioides sp. MH1 TaxID=3242490 RepID=UPI00352106EB
MTSLGAAVWTEPGADPAGALGKSIRRFLMAAGYPADVTRLVLAVLEKYGDPDAPAEGFGVRDVASLVEGLDPEDAIKRVLKAAGVPPPTVRAVTAALEPREEPAEVDVPAAITDVLRKAGYSAIDRRRVLAALEPPKEVEAEAVPGIANLLSKAGYPVDVRRRVLAALNAPAEKEVDVPESIRLLLRQGGYKADLGQLVASLLERYGDPELAESGLRVADLQPLVEVTHHDFDAREPVRRILRTAGYRVDLVNFVILLLERYTGSDVPVSGVRIRDLADLVEDTDEKLLSLLRHWRTAAPDDHLLGNELATVLGRRGVEPEVARDLAAAIENDSGEGQLVELARVARFALSAEDACVSMAEPAWLDDPAFTKAYAEAKSISAWGRDIRWRVQTLVKAAAAARHVAGDFVECGVDTGGTARAVMAYLGDDAFEDRTFYLFDTFHGIVPEQLLPDEPAPIQDRYPDVADVARANFADKPYVRIVEGTVPETLSQYVGTRVAYLHIDMNAAYPEVEAFRFFWELLAPGAPVVFDDYGFPRHRAQRRALDEVAASLGVEIMMLPTCQGIVHKPVEGA